MPSDSNGNYSLPAGYLGVTGSVIQTSQHNPPLEDIAAAISARVSRNGAAPMTGPLRLIDGEATQPSLAFASNPSVGIYLKNGKINFSGGFAICLPIGLGPLPWPGSNAPPGWVFVGQTYSRVTYADLWAFAQAEIAAGNTLFNNGDGSSTFGIVSVGGRSVAGREQTATLLTSPYFNGDSTKLGATGGGQSQTLVMDNLPPITPGGSVTDPVGHYHYLATGAATVAANSVPDANSTLAWQIGNANNLSYSYSIPNANFGEPDRVRSSRSYANGLVFEGTPQGGKSTPISTVPPCIITNQIMFAGA